MEVVFHKLNFYALAACVCSTKEISCENALQMMGAKAPSKTYIITKPRCTSKVFDSDLDEIKRLYFEEMKGLKEIAKIYKCSFGSISYLFKRHGVQIRPKGRQKERV